MVYCTQTAPTALTYLIEIVFGLCMAVAQDPARVTGALLAPELKLKHPNP